MEVNSYSLRENLAAVFSLGANGVVGSAATVDTVSSASVDATASGLTLTLSAPTDTRAGREFRVLNVGTNAFAMYGVSVAAGSFADFIWSGSAWFALSALSAGGTSCPAPMTSTALLALRTANSLNPACTYVITDFAQGRFSAGTLVLLNAVSNNSLSLSAHILSSYDNSAWACEFDIDTLNLNMVADNRGNVVRSTVFGRVASFDWGNPAYQNNTINGTITLTIGATQTFANNIITSTGDVTLTSRTGGTITGCVFSGVASLDNSNISLTTCTQENGTTLTVTGYTGGVGMVRTRLTNAGAFITGAGAGQINLTNVEISAGTITHTSASSFTMSNSRVGAGAGFSHTASAGASTTSGCDIFGTSTQIALSAGGTVSMTGSQIGPYGRVIKDNAAATSTLTIISSKISSFAYIAHRGPGAITVSNTELMGGSFVENIALATATIVVSNSNLAATSRITTTATATAGSLSVTNTSMSSASQIDKSGTGNLSSTFNTLNGFSRFVNSGVRNITTQYNVLNANSQLLCSAAGGAGVSDNIVGVTIASGAFVRFAATGAAGNSLFNSLVVGGSSSVQFLGTTTGFTPSQLTVDNSTVTFTNNTVASVSIFDMVFTSRATFTMNGCSAAQDVRYSHVASQGIWTMTNRTVASLNFNMNINSSGQLNQTATAGNAQQVVVTTGGIIAHNGGALLRFIKDMTGTLTTGAFTHTDCQHRVAGSKTLTANNTSRADYQGVTTLTPLV